MKHFSSLLIAATLAMGCTARPAAAAPRPSPNLASIQVTYHGGRLLRRVRVITLFWGSDWKSSSLPAYFNGFFRTLFADGRYMANLAQYSTSDYAIGNGIFGGTTTDATAPADQVSDLDIRTEILSQIQGGTLRKPDEDTVYFVFTPPNVVVSDPSGANSEQNFAGYHFYQRGSTGFLYAAIPYDSQYSDPHLMTLTMSHELAEAVTDPEPDRSTLGWYDNNNGEIGDIPISLVAAGRLKPDDVVDELDGSDGWIYLVQKEWSVQDAAPVAFAAPSG